VPDGDGFIVIGSNWGERRHPAWALNLLARPEATVTRKGRSFPVQAQLLSGRERDRAWRLALEHWPAYQTYAERAGSRDLHVFRLQPVGRPDSHR
jgi:deazaflavin-dependent oxidoreductase (nitroreductase family)